MLRVSRGFYDNVEKRVRKVGEEFSASPEREAELASLIPGYVTTVAEPRREPTMAELRTIARERGIDVPKGASRQRLQELLGD